MQVAPFAGAWIETQPVEMLTTRYKVSHPCMGAWIETLSGPHEVVYTFAAPCAGARIETPLRPVREPPCNVAAHAGGVD